jgi:alkyldihydroxyacetonephosphate synthase
MGVAVENIELVAGELRQRLGTDAVLTDEGLLDAYEADTYWKAIASRASGSPLGRPDLVVLARSDEDVATVLQLANQFGVPSSPGEAVQEARAERSSPMAGSLST